MSSEKLEVLEGKERKEMQMSDKVSAIRRLPDSDNKEAIVQEINALENFTFDERSSIFGNSDILWIIKNFTIRELKERAEKSLIKLDLKVGDVIRYDHQTCVVLSVRGRNQDRLTILFLQEGDFRIVEGVSIYNVSQRGHVDIDSLLSELMK